MCCVASGLDSQVLGEQEILGQFKKSVQNYTKLGFLNNQLLRVTDHRINLTLHKLEEFLEGEAFDEMIENLTLQAQEESLNNLN